MIADDPFCTARRHNVQCVKRPRPGSGTFGGPIRRKHALALNPFLLREKRYTVTAAPTGTERFWESLTHFPRVALPGQSYLILFPSLCTSLHSVGSLRTRVNVHTLYSASFVFNN